jgi:two-component sensor histidine kinase
MQMKPAGGDASAPVRARMLVQEACRRWGLPALIDPAQLIVSELVSNSVRHAQTDLELTIALGDHYLHLHVRDRDQQVPRIVTADSADPEHSRGMKLVDGLAAGWGTTLRPYGKLVWATLRIKQRNRTPSP